MFPMLLKSAISCFRRDACSREPIRAIVATAYFANSVPVITGLNGISVEAARPKSKLIFLGNVRFVVGSYSASGPAFFPRVYQFSIQGIVTIWFGAVLRIDFIKVDLKRHWHKRVGLHRCGCVEM